MMFIYCIDVLFFRDGETLNEAVFDYYGDDDRAHLEGFNHSNENDNDSEERDSFSEVDELRNKEKWNLVLFTKEKGEGSHPYFYW